MKCVNCLNFPLVIVKRDIIYRYTVVCCETNIYFSLKQKIKNYDFIGYRWSCLHGIYWVSCYFILFTTLVITYISCLRCRFNFIPTWELNNIISNFSHKIAFRDQCDARFDLPFCTRGCIYDSVVWSDWTYLYFKLYYFRSSLTFLIKSLF